MGIPSWPAAGGSPHNRVALGGKGSKPWYTDNMCALLSLSCDMATIEKQSRMAIVSSFIACSIAQDYLKLIISEVVFNGLERDA